MALLEAPLNRLEIDLAQIYRAGTVDGPARIRGFDGIIEAQFDVAYSLRNAGRFVFETVVVTAVQSDLLRQHVEQRTRGVELVRDRVGE